MNFIGYLREYYPDVDIDSILNYSGITIYELKDPGHWFTQRQADRFYEIVLQKTGNRNIAREAGRHFTSSQTSGGLRQYVLGFMTLRYAYHMLEKIVPRLTKASRLETRQIGREKVEVTFWPKPDVNEKPYQCDNRMGMLESMGELFTNKLARVEHPSCLHRRDDVCRYVVAWEKSISFTLNRIRNYFALLSLVGVMVLFFLIPTISLMTFIAFSIYVVLGISLCSSQIEKKELIKNMGSQGSAANELLNEINVRYNNALLIEKVGQAISIILDIDKLLKSIMHAIENLLEFDRGMIMLANRDETQLVYSVGYGYRPEQESAFKKAQFSLASPWSRGVAVRAFKQQKAFLVSDISEIEKDLSQRSLRFLRSTGSQSFILVPIVYEGKSLGVLFVDNLRSKKSLTQSDMSLLMGIAPQIAISIHNARSYQQIQEGRQREFKLRRLFEKYVPAPIIKRYLATAEADLFGGDVASITAMFLDIRGFTARSEDMEASRIVSFLNAYFERCSVIISENHGHINKYTGDGFLAIFGAPEPLQRCANLAFDAAAKILNLYGSFVLGCEPIEVGIGLHSGTATLGNIGSQTKIEYTAIGDTVNVAARLQELTKTFQEFPLIMSRHSWNELAGHPYHDMIRNLGKLEIRGKKEKLEAFGFSPFEDHRLSGLDNEVGFLPLHRIKGV